jgi:hypothetical protein
MQSIRAGERGVRPGSFLSGLGGPGSTPGGAQEHPRGGPGGLQRGPQRAYRAKQSRARLCKEWFEKARSLLQMFYFPKAFDRAQQFQLDFLHFVSR